MYRTPTPLAYGKKVILHDWVAVVAHKSSGLVPERNIPIGWRGWIILCSIIAWWFAAEIAESTGRIFAPVFPSTDVGTVDARIWATISACPRREKKRRYSGLIRLSDGANMARKSFLCCKKISRGEMYILRSYTLSAGTVPRLNDTNKNEKNVFSPEIYRSRHPGQITAMTYGRVAL